MKFALVENAGPDSVRNVLCSELKKAREVCVGVAFVTSSGLDEIIQPLRDVAAHGKVHLLTGLYQHITETSALWSLLAVQNQTNRRFSVRVSKEPAFHRKLYMIAKKNGGMLLVGSSNLTREGLRSRGELSALLRFPAQSSDFDEARRIFAEDWKYAVDLNKNLIEKYGKKRAQKPGRPAVTSSELSEILGKHRVADETDQVQPIWRRVALSSAGASEKSERIVSETTDWDDQGYGWWVWDENPKWHTGESVFLFDCFNQRVSWVRLMAFAKSKMRNADGRYFVAHKEVPHHTRRFTHKFWRELKAIGITKKSACDAYRNPLVKPTLAEALKGLIRRVQK
jgi:HKD family nuclease